MLFYRTFKRLKIIAVCVKLAGNEIDIKLLANN